MTLEPTALKCKKDYIDYFRSIGLNVIPCQPRKKEPAVAWKKYQNEKYIEDIGDENNIAILCGKVSGDLFVVDLDAPELIQDFEGLKNNTLVVQSGSGGYHIYCKPNGEMPHTMRFSNPKGQHVDIQSDGTYVVAPPSVHPDSGEEYKVVSSTLNIGMVSFAAILNKLNKHGFETEKGSKSLGDIIKGVGQGERNANAFKYACYLLQRELLDDDTAWYQLQRWNEKNKPPLEEKELETIFKSAARYERPEEKPKSKQSKEDEPTHADYAKIILSREHFASMSDTGEVLHYADGVYRYNGEAVIKRMCQGLIPDCSRYMTSEVIAYIERETMKDRNLFDADIKMINFKNCWLNIETFEKIEHSPELLSTVQIPVTFDPAKLPRKFLRFLIECLPRRKDFVTALEQFALCLLRTSKFSKGFMHLGTGQNGKSTYFHVVESFLGKQNVSHISIHELDESRFSKAELVGKLANIYADISNTELKNVGVLKIMISGDTITVEKKNKNPFPMENYAKLFFSANQIPEVYDDSDGFYRRFTITEWRQQFSRPNVNLKYELVTEDEKSGVLNVLLVFLKELEKRGHMKYAESIDTLRQKWKDQANSIDAFMRMDAVYDSKEHTDKRTFFQTYYDFCKDNKLPTLKNYDFNKQLKDYFGLEEVTVRIDGVSRRCWANISLKSKDTKGNKTIEESS